MATKKAVSKKPVAKKKAVTRKTKAAAAPAEKAPAAKKKVAAKKAVRKKRQAAAEEEAAAPTLEELRAAVQDVNKVVDPIIELTDDSTEKEIAKELLSCAEVLDKNDPLKQSTWKTLAACGLKVTPPTPKKKVVPKKDENEKGEKKPAAKKKAEAKKDKPKKSKIERNKYGHRPDKMAGVIDAAFMRAGGATKEEARDALMAEYDMDEKRAGSRINGHLRHLQADKELDVTPNKKGKIKI